MRYLMLLNRKIPTTSGGDDDERIVCGLLMTIREVVTECNVSTVVEQLLSMKIDQSN